MDKINVSSSRMLYLINTKTHLSKLAYRITGKNPFIYTRRISVVYDRQTIMYILKTTTDMSLDEIGFVCCSGQKAFSHCTVLHSVKMVEAELEIYPERRENLMFWLKIIQQNKMEIHKDEDIIKFLDSVEKDHNNEQSTAIINKIKNLLGYDQEEIHQEA